MNQELFSHDHYNIYSPPKNQMVKNRYIYIVVFDILTICECIHYDVGPKEVSEDIMSILHKLTTHSPSNIVFHK